MRQGPLVPREAEGPHTAGLLGAVKWKHVPNGARDSEGQTSGGTWEVSHREQHKRQMLGLQSRG